MCAGCACKVRTVGVQFTCMRIPLQSYVFPCREGRGEVAPLPGRRVVRACRQADQYSGLAG